ncbi:MAG: transposase, partial [Proteobacteria bacterium]
GNGSKGGRPPYDPIAMLKVLVLAAPDNVADARMEYLIRDRLCWLPFLGFDLGAPTLDANTIRLFREKLTQAGALDAVFIDFDRQVKEGAYLARGGQIVDATLVSAPKQRNTAPEKDAIKAGRVPARSGPTSPRGHRRRTRTRAVRSSSPRPDPWRTAGRTSISPSRALATRVAYRSG